MGVSLDAPSQRAATALLERVAQRHGGRTAFEATKSLDLRIEGIGGVLPWLKGVGRRFPPATQAQVFPHRRRTVFRNTPEPDRHLIFERGTVWRTDDPNSDPPSALSHRARFTGLRKLRGWQPEDAAYFFGYALLDYISNPFTLSQRELLAIRRRGDAWELDVRFPCDAHTHSRVQSFRFDESGLLVRHDYRAEIMGAAFNGAHISRDFTTMGSLVVAQCRTVYAKAWHVPARLSLGIPVLRATLRPA